MGIDYYILAIDQSTKISGFAVMDAKGKLIEYGYWDTGTPGNTEYDHTVRRGKLKKHIEEILTKYPNIVQVICEGVHLTSFKGKTSKRNVETFKKLAKCQGSIEDLCLEIGINCFTFNSSSWRSHIDYKFGRKRQEQKEKAKEYVLQQYEIESDLREDTYEAICMGVAYLNMVIDIAD